MYKYFIALLFVAALYCLACRSGKESPSNEQATTEVVKVENDYLNRFDKVIQAYEAADKESESHEGKIVFTGSSSIRMWKTLEDDMKPLRAINRGFGGSTIPEVTHFAERIIVPYQPRCVVLYGGDNDIVSEKVTPKVVLETLKAYQAKIQEHLPGTKTWFIAIKPSIRRKHLLEKAKTTNKMVYEYTKQDAFMEYIDVATPMMVNPEKIRSDIFIKDSLHMNALGYEIWTPVVKNALIEACK